MNKNLTDKLKREGNSQEMPPPPPPPSSNTFTLPLTLQPAPRAAACCRPINTTHTSHARTSSTRHVTRSGPARNMCPHNIVYVRQKEGIVGNKCLVTGGVFV